MKKFYLILILACLFSPDVTAEIPTGYYSRLDGKKKEALKEAAYTTIRPHTVVTYNSLFPNQFPKTDVYPELVNGQQRWWEMYSDIYFYVRDGWKGMNREHSFPKSWWGGTQNEAYTDLYHLYPSESDANIAKSNYPLGMVETTTFDNGISKVGYAVKGNGGGATRVFEPADEYKGDFARTYFYVVTCYQDYTWKYTYMAQNGAYPSLQPWAITLLLDWAKRDPVSQKEIDRNEAVYKIQGNRNPFIDFPELAEYIWGSRTTETFYVKEQGGVVTPPVTGDPELFSPIDGSSLDFGEVAVGHSQTMELLINGTNLTSALSVRVTGADRSMFKLSGITDNQIPAPAINSEDGYKLTVIYTPAKTGVHSAAITLYDGGFPAGKNYNIQLRAEALEVPVLSKPEAMPASNISATGYTANWKSAPEVVDYYIVNRTRYLPGNVQLTREVAEENYLVIEDRQEDVAESYTVQSVRLGIESTESDMVMVASGSVVGVESALPLNVANVEGGIMLLLDQRQTGLRICDIAGNIVVSADEVCGGEYYPLPQGVYLLCTKQSPRPLRIIVR